MGIRAKINPEPIDFGINQIRRNFPGAEEAEQAAKTLAGSGYKFDVAFTSVLKRANKTLEAILKGLKQENIPVNKSWRLNERHYGGLTGLNKSETAAKYGEAQVSKNFGGWFVEL